MTTIKTTETIRAAPETVWQILTDIDSYPEWNPFIVEGSGEFRRGARVQLKMQPPGGKALTFRPTVLEADAPRELRWRGRLLIPGLFDGEHWFRLDPQGDAATSLEQGEVFTGLLPRFMGKAMTRTEAGFVALNRALKDRAEGQPPAEAG